MYSGRSKQSREHWRLPGDFLLTASNFQVTAQRGNTHGRGQMDCPDHYRGVKLESILLERRLPHMPRILLKGERKVVAQEIPGIPFFKGVTKYPQILMFWRWCRQRRWEDFLRLCGKFIPWKRARAGWWHPRASCLRDALSTSLSVRSRHNRNTAAEAAYKNGV